MSLYPAFLDLRERDVVIVGGGPVAASKLDGLLAVGARITVIAPAIVSEIEARARLSGVALIRRGFEPADLDGAWWVVAAATPEINREVARAATARHVFVNAVDDKAAATAYLGGVVRRGPVELAILDGWCRAGARRPRARGARRAVAARPRALGRRRHRRARRLEGRGGADGRTPAATPARARRALRIAIDSQGGRMSGFVSLVGAGPGDPELLTLRAADRLRRADLVLDDALVPYQLLELAPQARRFFVGKRAGRHSIDQADIHRLMIKAARGGRRVVRLKCGDPFVLGRGGEEALALEAAGVAYEVIPGLSSAIAAPALAGIPVTHRGVASAFAVVSGHAESAFGPVLDGIAPGSLTLVVLMGLRTRAAIASRLRARGWSADTPAAIVWGASHTGGTRWLGSLAALSDPEAAPASPLPGVLVVGAAVALASQLDQLAFATGAAPEVPVALEALS